MKLPFHHFVLAIYPILFLYSANPYLVEARHLIIPLSLYLGAALLIWAVFTPIFHDRVRAAVLVSLWLILFSAYGHVYAWLDHQFSAWLRETGLGTDTGRTLHWILGTLWVSLILAVPLACERFAKSRVLAVSSALTWFSVVIVAFPAISIGSQLMRGADSTLKPTAELASISSEAPKTTQYPDVYVIVLDGYARRDILAQHYGYENDGFLTFLDKTGFQVAEDARSNYSWSLLSIPSMLNFKYLSDLMEYPKGDVPDISPLIELFRSNHFARALRKKGLQHVHLQSTYAATMRNPYADQEFGCSGRFGVDFYRLVVEASLLRIWSSAVINDLAKCHLEQFQMLEYVARAAYPKFVFAHFILPHPPYVFDDEGNIREQVAFSDQFHVRGHGWSRRDEYVDQLKFVNTRISTVIERILNNSARQSVIVLVSDHGPKLTDAAGRPEPDYRDARFANLIAVRSPNDRLRLPDDATLVNLFRYLLNAHFGEALEVLENRHFEAPTGNPFDQNEVFFQEGQ